MEDFKKQRIWKVTAKKEVCMQLLNITTEQEAIEMFVKHWDDDGCRIKGEDWECKAVEIGKKITKEEFIEKVKTLASNYGCTLIDIKIAD